MSLAFDPMSSIQLPVPRFTTLDVTFVPFNVVEREGDQLNVAQMPCLDILITGGMTAADLKDKFALRMGLITDDLRVCIRPQDGLI